MEHKVQLPPISQINGKLSALAFKGAIENLHWRRLSQNPAVDEMAICSFDFLAAHSNSYIHSKMKNSWMPCLHVSLSYIQQKCNIQLPVLHLNAHLLSLSRWPTRPSRMTSATIEGPWAVCVSPTKQWVNLLCMEMCLIIIRRLMF